MEIKKVIYKHLSSLTNKKFDDDSNIFDIGIDSLDLVELVMDAEKELNIQISDEALESIKKVKDIATVFEKAK